MSFKSSRIMTLFLVSLGGQVNNRILRVERNPRMIRYTVQSISLISPPRAYMTGRGVKERSSKLGCVELKPCMYTRRTDTQINMQLVIIHVTPAERRIRGTSARE